MPAFVVVAVDVLPPPLQRVFVPSRPPLITVCPIFTLRRNIKFLSHHHHHSRPASPLLLHPVPSPTSRLLWQIWSVEQDSRSLIRQSLSIYYHFISQRLFPQHKKKNGRAKDGPFFSSAAGWLLLLQCCWWQTFFHFFSLCETLFLPVHLRIYWWWTRGQEWNFCIFNFTQSPFAK